MKYEVAFKGLKEKFGKVDAAKLDNMAIQFTLSDEDCGGTFYAEAKDGVLNVEPYDYRDNNAIVDVSRQTLIDIIDGKITVDKAIDDGDLTVKGDLEKIKSVVNAISTPIKADVKPAVETKITAKAEAAAPKKTVAEVKAPVAKKAPAKKAPVKNTAKKTTKAAKKATR